MITYEIYYVESLLINDEIVNKKHIEYALDDYNDALDLLIRLNLKSRKEYRLDTKKIK